MIKAPNCLHEFLPSVGIVTRQWLTSTHTHTHTHTQICLTRCACVCRQIESQRGPPMLKYYIPSKSSFRLLLCNLRLRTVSNTHARTHTYTHARTHNTHTHTHTLCTSWSLLHSVCLISPTDMWEWRVISGPSSNSYSRLSLSSSTFISARSQRGVRPRAERGLLS